ncbi:MAG: hypothetical protein KUG65_12555 [Sphingomonadaceae bacterium]|nr:hypothetical protein [Sphingomonadaceae bacterium]
MPKFKMLVFSDAAKGGDEANYNKWYNEQHIPDVCRVDGFTGAQRFKIDEEASDQKISSYLAIYELEAASPEAAIANLRLKVGTDEMIMTDDIDIDNAKIMVYEQISEPYTA